MKKPILLFAALAVVASGWMWADFAFQLNRPLQGPEAGVSLSGTNYLGLAHTVVGVTDARDLFQDIGGSIISINQHRKWDDRFEVYTFGGGSLPPKGWSLEPTDCFVVRVASSQAYIYDGVEDSFLAVSLDGPGPDSRSGTNYYTHIAHGIASTARELFEEIGGCTVSIERHRPVDDAFDIYTFGGGSLPPDGWPLEPSYCMIVKVSCDVSFPPLHW